MPLMQPLMQVCKYASCVKSVSWVSYTSQKVFSLSFQETSQNGVDALNSFDIIEFSITTAHTREPSWALIQTP